jgi:mono/diheme cytochrome c family protein
MTTMKHVFVVVVLLAACYGIRVQLRAPAPQPIRAAIAAAADTSVARGRVVYDRYGCSMCHGADGKGGFANANAETDGKVPGVTYVAEGFTRRELRQKILDGFAAVGRKDPNGPRPPYRMPGWAGQMTDGEVADLVEYLWSLYPKTETEKWR